MAHDGFRYAAQYPASDSGMDVCAHAIRLSEIFSQRDNLVGKRLYASTLSEAKDERFKMLCANQETRIQQPLTL